MPAASGPSRPRHLVLAGCGHAHLFVLEALARRPIERLRVTLISPDEEYFYSGMIPGVVAGCYRPDEARFRPPRLAAAAGARWVQASVRRVVPASREVVLDRGDPLPYDLLSVDIGSRLAGDELPGVRDHAVPVKPMRDALRLVPAAAAAADRADASRPARIVVVGGGAAGVEMSVCLDAWLKAKYGRHRHRLTLLEAGEKILAGHSARFRVHGARLLAERGIAVRTRVRVDSVGGDELTASGGGAFPHDLLLWATGPRAPRLLRDSGLPTDAAGYLLVRSTLRSTEYPDIFAAGDCVAFAEHPWVPKAGVYAVREGPLLADNLRRHLEGRRLTRYRPQRHWLSLMNTGERRALLDYRGWAWRGRSAWRLKDWIDRRFVERFRQIS